MALDPMIRELMTQFLTILGGRIEKIVTTLVELEVPLASSSETMEFLLRELHTIKGESQILGLIEASKFIHEMETLLKKLQTKPETVFVIPAFFRALDSIQEMVELTLQDKPCQKNLTLHLESMEGKKNKLPDTRILEPKKKKIPSKEDIPSKTNILSSSHSKIEDISFSLEEMASLSGRIQKQLKGFKVEREHLKDFFKHWMSWKTEINANQISMNSDSHNMERELARILEQEGFLCEEGGDLLFDLESKTEELIHQVTSLRLRPLSLLKGAFQRGVFEMSTNLGKKIRFQSQGMETEIDKNILEALQDPILHILKNSIDHGIEFPVERKKIKKKEEGTIFLTAQSKGLEVKISILDDGKGIDENQILKRALDLKLLNKEQSTFLSKREKLELIFLPGFSTSEKISLMSGRGVGLDVVKKSIEFLGGKVVFSSEKGQGSHFDLYLPISLSRLPCLILQVGKFFLLIPSHYVEKVIHLREDEIQEVNKQRHFIYEEKRISLEWLHTRLGISITSSKNKIYPVVLFKSPEGIHYAFLVDRFLGEQVLLLKSFNSFLKKHPFFSSGSVLENGALAYLLNVSKLYEKSDHSPIAPIHKAKKKKILIVEDSLITREMEKNILESFGYQVSEAENGKKALPILEKEMPDLLITDLEMPEMGGLELVRTIRKEKKWKNLPIIMITTKGSREDKQAGLQAGVDAYIVKSEFQDQNFLKIIQKWI